MKKCEKCEEELNEGWDVCWKCSHNHKKETIIPKESSIKTGDDTSVLLNLTRDNDTITPKESSIKNGDYSSVLLNLTKDNVTVQKIEHLSSLCFVLSFLSILGSIYYIVNLWKYTTLLQIGGVILTCGVWCYFLLGITRLVESVIYLYKKQQS